MGVDLWFHTIAAGGWATCHSAFSSDGLGTSSVAKEFGTSAISAARAYVRRTAGGDQQPTGANVELPNMSRREQPFDYRYRNTENRQGDSRCRDSSRGSKKGVGPVGSLFRFGISKMTRDSPRSFTLDRLVTPCCLPITALSI